MYGKEERVTQKVSKYGCPECDNEDTWNAVGLYNVIQQVDVWLEKNAGNGASI